MPGRRLAELEHLVRAHPLDERLWAQLMLALYRSGRQADALGAYQQARRHLVDELGIEPGPELADLEHRILGHDPTLGFPGAQRAEVAANPGPTGAPNGSPSSSPTSRGAPACGRTSPTRWRVRWSTTTRSSTMRWPGTVAGS